jgi:glycosyltransferase involved in cell wall biosynthesis
MKVTILRSRATHPNTFKLAKTIAKGGYDVNVVVWDRRGNYTDHAGDYNVTTFNLRAPIDALAAFLYLPFWIFFLIRYLLTDDSDIIHAADLDTLIPSVLVKLIKKFRLCYTIFDFYADTALGRFPLWLRRIFASIEKFGIGFTDTLFLVTDAQIEEVQGAKIKKCVVLYNSPETPVNSVYEPGSGEGICTPEYITIFYAGILQKERGIETIIDIVRENEKLRLIVAGVGPDQSLFENLPAEEQQRIIYLGWIPHEQVLYYESKSDILFSYNKPDFPNNKYAIPNKVLEAMLCGKPIIVNEGTYAADIVRRENFGLVVPFGNKESFQKAIIMLQDNPDVRAYLGWNGKQAYNSRYCWEKMQILLLDAYREISLNCRSPRR